MSNADVRDMLDLPAAAAGHSRPLKKQKIVEKRPDGISRELYSLMGDNAAGVQLREPLKYKEKPKLSKKVRTWDMTPFTNPSRTDGLVLKHWKMTADNVADDVKKKGPLERPEPAAEEEYPFKKYDVKVTLPEYTPEQYEEHLKSESWTKEETDYLMELCLDYDLRWILIADRYEYQSSPVPTTDTEGDTALIPAPQVRTMEDLKARYYTIAAKCLAISRPPANMTTTEFELYEKMRKFDPVRETTRKTIADSLMRRTIEEVNEEKFLLSELKRIVESEELLLSERRELYARLDAPQSNGNVSQYHNSAGISQLMQTLLNADKNKKRRSLLPGEGGGMSSPATAHANSNLPNRGDHDGGTSTKQKQPSISHPPATKRLSAADEAKYGVSHHSERLVSGVQFRSDRAIKSTQAKSQAQTQKLQAALTELGLPPRLTMPTAKVVADFERLIGVLQLVLELRRVSERVESEAKVIENMVREREKKARRDAGLEEEEEETVQATTEDVVMGDESVDQGNENEETGELDADVKMEDENGDDDEEVEEGANEDGENDEADVEVDEDDSRIQGNAVAEEGDEVENEEGERDENEIEIENENEDENDDDGDGEVEVDIDAEDEEDEAEEDGGQENDSGAELEEQENDVEAEDDQGSPEVQLDEEEEEEEDQESGEDQDDENENGVEDQASDAEVEEELNDLGGQEEEQESENSEAGDQDQDQEDAEEPEPEDQAEEEEEQEPALLDPDKGPLAAARKRSASVMSGASRGSARSMKRGRK